MTEHRRKLLTVVTEAALESTLIRELTELGVHGYTLTDARGRGTRGVRDAGWATDANIRLEVICDDDKASQISRRLRERYSDDYAMIMFIAEVEVLRPEKF